MATTNTQATGTGLFVDKFSGSLEDLVPDAARLASEMPFEVEEKLPGNLYHQAVRLGIEHGAHFNTDGSDFSLSDPGPIAAVYQDAQVRGAACLMPTRVAYVAAQRAMKGGSSSYVKNVKPYVDGNALGIGFHAEISMLYGQYGLCRTSEVASSSTSGSFTVTAATWAPALWKTMIGAKCDVLDTLTGSVINTTAAIVISGVTESTRVVSFTNNASDASALDALTTAVIVRRGAYLGSSSWAEPAGLFRCLTNTGTLFNISASDYPLTKPFNQACGSASLTYGKIIQGLTGAQSNGLVDTDVVIDCSPPTLGDLQVDGAALRHLDTSYNTDKFVNGTKGVEFHGQTGKVTVRSHIYMWEGSALCRVLADWKRIGSTDVTYNAPGMPDEQMLLHLGSNAGWEFRSFYDYAPFCSNMGKNVYFDGITNSFT